ncbi:MAG: uroporphyrinogen-III synthase [Actinobacteria bacterium]|nr:uroporphyrinogen-III synthase [Actinomycetota bacterium]
MRVLVLRPEDQGGELASLIEQRGHEAIVIPAIEIVPPSDWGPIDEALGRADGFDWIVFTSSNGVRSILERMEETGIDKSRLPKNIGAIGPGTKAALARHGLEVDWMPTRYTTVAVSEELPDPPATVLLVRADIATPVLETRLMQRGFEVERIDAYRTNSINAARIRQAVWDRVDAIALTSASIVRSFLEAIEDRGALEGIQIASIGPATTEALHEAGIEPSVEADPHTAEGLADGLLPASRGR